jgi:5-formyltetrahydrofolate cyclo-ligase
MTIQEEKERIRQQLLKKRRAILYEDRARANDAIFHHVMSHPVVTQSQVICSYVSLAEEVDTTIVIDALITGGKTVVVPKVQPDMQLGLFAIESIRALSRGAVGILEPHKTDVRIDKKAVDCFFIPGIGFDRQGNRLGWGKGYYDRLLSGISAPKIGLAFACQILPRVPHESYDIVMTEIVTEKILINK